MYVVCWAENQICEVDYGFDATFELLTLNFRIKLTFKQNDEYYLLTATFIKLQCLKFINRIVYEANKMNWIIKLVTYYYLCSSYNLWDEWLNCYYNSNNYFKIICKRQKSKKYIMLNMVSNVNWHVGTQLGTSYVVQRSLNNEQMQFRWR